MSTASENEKADLALTGRKYSSVDDLISGEGFSQESQKAIFDLEQQTRVALCLAKLRQQAGITQEALAEKLGVSQSAISKLESGDDSDITLKEIVAYSRATKQRVLIAFGKPPTHVEAIKSAALEIKEHLDCLAKIANQDEELEKEIASFFNQALFNILSIIAKCSEGLPNGAKNKDSGIRMRVVRHQLPRESKRESSATECASV